MRQQVVGAAIDRFLGDDVIALLCKRFNRVADGSCAGGDCQRSRTAFQGGNALFKNILGIGTPSGGTIRFDGEDLLKLPKRDRARRITAAALSGVFALCCLGEFFIRDAFRQFMTPASIIAGAGGVAGEYSGMAFELIGRGWWRFLLYFSPIVAYLLLDRRHGRTAVRAARQAALGIICAVTFLLAHVLTLTVSPDKNRYAAEYSFDGAVHAFGLSAAVRLEMQHLLFPARGALGPAGSADVGVSQPEDSGQNSSDAADVPQKDNTLPIDYAALAAAADDEELTQIYRYVARQTPSGQNAYTGLFRGKNLILITAEAFSAEAIDPQRTPTLYRLANKGIRFTDYYQPAWGGSTSTGEYANLMGLVPTAGVSSMKRTVGHDLRHTIGNGLLRLGYHATAYHDHTYSYYDRDKTHKNFGYTEYIGIGNGMEAGVRKTWPESDREMMRFTVPRYIGRQPFSVYYMTVSGHCNYTRTGNYIVDKNYGLLPDDGRGELVHGYLAGQLELEYGMQELVRSLEEAGIADDTVIVLSTDHYPYGLDKDVLVRHGTISIDIPNLSFEGIRRGLELAAMEGIVFWHEGAPLCKIKRSDFGFKWPVTQDELNAEFGANNPDPCELVRRTAAMYSRHEFPTDMTKMFEVEHEAAKEETQA